MDLVLVHYVKNSSLALSLIVMI